MPPHDDAVNGTGDVTDRRRLLAAQEGIWTGQQLDPDSPAYNTAEYVHIAGPVDSVVFDAALHHVVAETEALNVAFDVDEQGRPRQTDAPAGEWRLHTADLTAEPDPHAAALAWMDRDMARPVDLVHGPSSVTPCCGSHRSSTSGTTVCTTSPSTASAWRWSPAGSPRSTRP
ncbi:MULTISPECIES: condensation domain-containing protein [unclassified Streptomyces]|uniref:condensation domain-containing protein n=1 Tax=unclassified Streptomyces TaxID=2593676 RepID=UPI0036E47F10